MASSNSAGRLAMSEPRPSRTRAYRVSNSTDATDDQHSTGATGGLSLQEDRLNNWVRNLILCDNISEEVCRD